MRLESNGLWKLEPIWWSREECILFNFVSKESNLDTRITCTRKCIKIITRKRFAYCEVKSVPLLIILTPIILILINPSVYVQQKSLVYVQQKPLRKLKSN
jgi:hypothetical protein